MLQHSEIRRGVPYNNHYRVWWCAGGSGPVRPGPNPWMELIVDEFPQDERGDLQGRHRRKMDPYHQRIPPALHPGALTGLGGDPDMLPGPRSHSVMGSQRQHRPRLEPAQSAGRCSAVGSWDDGPPPPLPEALAVLAHE